MVFHMKTTLEIPDTLMMRLKEEAARRRTTMSALVESALRRLLDEHERPAPAAALPVFGLGRPGVDVANREALYEVMEG